MMSPVVCVLFAFLHVSASISQSASKTAQKSIVVQLGTQTTARGQVNEAKDARPVYTFYGLPYAQKPQRFLPAEPLKLQHGEYVANNSATVCQQYPFEGKYSAVPYDIRMDEDCLFLNIFTPSVDPMAKLDVMVWIHGGAFMWGGAVLYPSTLLPRLHNVVYVAINYRLAGLGFLTTGDEHAPGNVGLRDQVQALQWISQYIQVFGGDPNKVTVFGESAGAMSVSYHLLSPMSKDLFKRAISESGVSTWANGVLNLDTAINTTYGIAKQHGCPIANTAIMTQCLRNLPPDVFTDPRKVFLPVVDGIFLKDSPWNVYALSKFNTKEYLLGFNSHEGYLLHRIFGALLRGLGFNIPLEINSNTAQDVIAGFVEFLYGPNIEIIKRVLQTYVGSDVNSDKLYQDIVQAVGDMWITGPTVSTADKHSTKAKTYLYYYNYTRVAASQSHRASWVKADHSDEIPMVLGPHSIESDTDKEVRAQIMSYWTNFAKTGNPNGGGLKHWPEYDCKERKYMILNEHSKVAADYKPDFMKLWNSTIPSLDRMHVYKIRPDEWKCTV